MRLFSSNKNEWKEVNTEAKRYLEIIDTAIKEASNDELNFMFAESFMLLLKVNRYDTFLKNIKDHRDIKLAKDKVEIIKLQFDDILEDLAEYKKEDLDLLNNLMKEVDSIIDNEHKNGWLALWEKIQNACNLMQK